jgi:YVTN family beta-propeller protein
MRALIFFLVAAAVAPAQTTEPLHLEKTIELPDVQGRIDHMSIDVKGQRLFVSALGNDTVEVIDIKAGKRVKTITGLAEPQGVLYVPGDDRRYVANAKDGSVRIFDGTSYALLKTIDYGDDADNLRYDAGRQKAVVG